jgi:hypothetical protein
MYSTISLSLSIFMGVIMYISLVFFVDETSENTFVALSMPLLFLVEAVTNPWKPPILFLFYSPWLPLPLGSFKRVHRNFQTGCLGCVLFFYCCGVGAAIPNPASAAAESYATNLVFVFGILTVVPSCLYTIVILFTARIWSQRSRIIAHGRCRCCISFQAESKDPLERDHIKLALGDISLRGLKSRYEKIQDYRIMLKYLKGAGVVRISERLEIMDRITQGSNRKHIEDSKHNKQEISRDRNHGESTNSSEMKQLVCKLSTKIAGGASVEV